MTDHMYHQHPSGAVHRDAICPYGKVVHSTIPVAVIPYEDERERASLQYLLDRGLRLVDALREYATPKPDESKRHYDIAYGCLFSSDGTEIARQWISRDFEGGDALEMTWAFGDPKPPKPDEPKGYGAIADVRGTLFHRIGSDTSPWVHVSGGSRMEFYSWADFPNSVQVRYEGLADR